MRIPSVLAPVALVLGTALAGCGGKNSTPPEPPGPPTALAISAGENQSGIAGQQLAAPIAVKVTDAKGRGVPGQTVTFSVIAGLGHVDQTSVTTNNAGVAFVYWTLSTNASSPQQVRAQLIDQTTGALVGSVVFHATATAGPAAQVVTWEGYGQSAFPGQRLADSIRVRVVDANGNPVPNVQVTFAVTMGGGSTSPTAAMTRADGIASTAWTVGTQPGSAQQLRATVAGVASSDFVTATVLRPREGTSVDLAGRPYALAVSHDIVYVGQLDAGQVTRFNGSSTTPAATIGVGNTPTELAFNPSGTKAYVTNQFSDNVGIIDVATNTETNVIGVTGDPFVVIVSPDEATLYVTTNANYVYRVDIASRTVTGSIATPATADGLALNSDGSKLYVSTRDGGSVMEVRTSDMTLLRTFTTGGRTQAVVVGPGDAELYVANEASGTLHVFNLTTGAQAATVSNLGPGPWGMALSPDGTKLWISILDSGEIKVVDRATRAVSRTVYVGGRPRRIGFLSNGTAVIANEFGYVTWVQ